MDIKIKKLYGDSQLPYKASDLAVGYDIYANSYEYDYEHEAHIYGTGIAIELPDDVECQIRPRSSIYKTDCFMTNSIGTVDPDYRGELLLVFKNVNKESLFNKVLRFLGLKSFFDRTPYGIGERIGQLVFNKIERPTFIEVDELSETKRGKGGHGSTGRG